VSVNADGLTLRAIAVLTLPIATASGTRLQAYITE
jgi:hypothetical protein